MQLETTLRKSRTKTRAAKPAPATDQLHALIAENARLKLELEQARESERSAMKTAADFEELMKGRHEYSPEVEAYRDDFDQLADALRTIGELGAERAPGVLDVDGYDDRREHLYDGRAAHIEALFNSVDWLDTRTIDRFYVDLRLWAKELELERASKQAAKLEGQPPNHQENRRCLAETLAIVLQHPATPKHTASIFRQIVGIVAPLAGTTTEAIFALRPGVAEMDFITVALDFGLAVADVLDDDDLDPLLWNEIAQCDNEIEGLLRPENTQEAFSSKLRAVMKEWARIQREPCPLPQNLQPATTAVAAAA